MSEFPAIEAEPGLEAELRSALTQGGRCGVRPRDCVPPPASLLRECSSVSEYERAFGCPLVRVETSTKYAGRMSVATTGIKAGAFIFAERAVQTVDTSGGTGDKEDHAVDFAVRAERFLGVAARSLLGDLCDSTNILLPAGKATRERLESKCRLAAAALEEEAGTGSDASPQRGKKRARKVGEATLKLVGVYLSNAHGMGGQAGLFPLASTLNHACRPNCGLAIDGEGVFYLIAERDVRPGEELTCSYLGDRDDDDDEGQRENDDDDGDSSSGNDGGNNNQEEEDEGDLYDSAVEARRAGLLESFNFECQCLKCLTELEENRKNRDM